ncbi:hypothetical protein I4U23_000634 [Adineta vaga]|nr:hypothetical protein I4U23_000634 [Adineta vaga]
MSKQKLTSSSSSTDVSKSQSKKTVNSSKSTTQRRSTDLPMVQNVLLVWLDEKIDEKGNHFWRDAIAEFRREINNIYTFKEADQCVLFLSKHNDEKICLIVSGSLSQKVIPTIYNLSQVYSILIFCDNKKQYKHWAKNWTKIFGIFTHSADIAEVLKDMVEMFEHDSIGINFLSMNDADAAKRALDFARDAVENPDLIGVLFNMSINPSKASTPFASISKVSSSQNTEGDILVSMFSIFRIRDMKQINGNNRLWQINLILLTNDDPELRIPIEHVHSETNPNSKGWGQLGIALIKMNEFEKARQVYKTMLEQMPDGEQKAGIYHQLGWIEDQQGHQDQSIAYYKKSLEVSQKALPSDHPDVAMSYNNIGLVYYNKGEYTKALSAHQKALAIRQKALPANHPDLAMSNNNIVKKKL